jgi:serine/threonine protein kinase
MTNDEQPRLPFKFPSYREVKLLGEGSYALVYLLKSNLDSSKAVIKVFKKSSIDDEFQFRYKRECKSLSSLNHKGIPEILNWGVSDGYPWLLMEYASGKTLSDYIADSFSSHILTSSQHFKDYEVQSIEVLRNISEALSYAHSMGFIHRDIKPDNILVCADRRIKLIDFGMVRRELQNTVETATGTIVGTPIFIDPQILFNQGEPSPATDIYSVGIVAYEMFAGKLPYPSQNVSVLVNALKNGECKTVKEVNPLASSWISEAITAMIAPSSGHRTIKSANKLIEILNTGEVSRKRNITLVSKPSGTLQTKVTTPISSLTKRVTVAFISILFMIGLLFFYLNSPSKDEMLDPIEKLLSEQKYNSLGQIAIYEKVFDLENPPTSAMNLIGKLYALKLYGSRDPQKSFSMYKELIDNKIFISLNLEETAFNLTLDIYRKAPEKYAQFFNSIIARAFFFARTDNPVKLLYDSHLKSISPIEHLLLNQLIFLEALNKRSFEELTPDEIADKGREIVNATEEFFHKNYSWTVVKLSYTEPSTEHYLKSSGANELYGYLRDIGNRENKTKEDMISREEFSNLLPLIGGTVSITHAILVDKFLTENKPTSSYGEKLKEDSSKLVSFWIKGREEKKGQPYFPAHFISRSVINALSSSSFNQKFHETFISALRGWNRYYDRKDTMKNTIQSLFIRSLVIKSIDVDNWGRKALHNKEQFENELKEFSSLIKTECSYENLERIAPLASDYQFYLTIGAQSLDQYDRIDDTILFVSKLVEELHKSPLLAAAVLPFIKSFSKKIRKNPSPALKHLKIACIDFYNDNTIPLELRTAYLPPLFSIILHESKIFRGFGHSYKPNTGLSGARIIKESADCRNIRSLSRISDSELGLLLWTASTNAEYGDAISTHLTFNLLTNRSNKLYEECETMTEKEYESALEALWLSAQCCKNIIPIELRMLTEKELKTPSLFQKIMHDAPKELPSNSKKTRSLLLRNEMRMMVINLINPCLIRNSRSGESGELPGTQFFLADICGKNYLSLMADLEESKILASIIEIIGSLAAQDDERSRMLLVEVLPLINTRPSFLTDRMARNLIKFFTSMKLLARALPIQSTDAFENDNNRIIEEILIPIDKQTRLGCSSLNELLKEDETYLPVSKGMIIEAVARAYMCINELDKALKILNSWDSKNVPPLERSRYVGLLLRAEWALYEQAKRTESPAAEKYKGEILSSLKTYKECYGNEWDLENTVLSAFNDDPLARWRMRVYK